MSGLLGSQELSPRGSHAHHSGGSGAGWLAIRRPQNLWKGMDGSSVVTEQPVEICDRLLVTKVSGPTAGFDRGKYRYRILGMVGSRVHTKPASPTLQA